MPRRLACPSTFQPAPPSTLITVNVIVFDDAGTPAHLPNASVVLSEFGNNYSGVTDANGLVTFPNVVAPALSATLTITATGFEVYTNTFTIETLPSPVTYVVGPPGTAVGAQIQLPALVVTGGGTGLCNTNLAIAQPGGIPARPNLRWWRGNFSGFVVPGMPFVPGGSTTPIDQVLSYFLDRYSPANQATILAAYTAAGFTHVVLSWPDSRSGNGQSVAQFVATCQAVQAAGFYTCVFLLSKVYDPADMNAAAAAPIIDPVIAALEAVNAATMYCVGWELNLFNDPNGPFQSIIDHVAGLVVPTRQLYVHFSPGVISWQPPGTFTNVFWNANVGKLTGLLHQRDPNASPDCPTYQARLADCQVRFGGAFGFPANSGFGHPFDCVAYEGAANEMFFGTKTQAQGDAIGKQAIDSPVPNPGVPVFGYGNGCTGNP